MKIIGHSNILRFLELSVAKQRLAHAYLFYGPPNVGKGAVAAYFAMNILNAPDLLGITSDLASYFIRGSHIDVVWLEKSEKKKSISIEQIRDLKLNLTVKSFSERKRVVIINEADCLTPGAANAFLKILEESPDDTIIILLAHYWQRVLSTIVSRCQCIKFNPVSLYEIKSSLVKNYGLRSDEAEFFARLSFGRPGIILSLIQDKEAISTFKNQYLAFGKMLNQNIVEKVKFIEDHIEAAPNLIWQGFLRDLLLYHYGLLDNSSVEQSRMMNNFSKWSIERIYRAIQLLQKTEKLFLLNLNKKLVLENFFINL